MADLTAKDLQVLKSVIKKLEALDTVKVEDIPSIDLYMDQVTTFMEEHLSNTRRYESDKILTKTMINNYAKNRLLPSPNKKKYSKDHMVLLILIYYLKNVMCINDIKTLLDPLTEEYFGGQGSVTLTEIYGNLLGFMEKEQTNFADSIKHYYTDSKDLYEDTDMSEEEKRRLRKVSFIMSLAFDIYMKKMMIETLLDEDAD